MLKAANLAAGWDFPSQMQRTAGIGSTSVSASVQRHEVNKRKDRTKLFILKTLGSDLMILTVRRCGEPIENEDSGE
jgi:hypothetical protein